MAVVLAAGFFFAPLGSTHAQFAVPPDDLQAIARSLGFLDFLPREGITAVAIVYAPGGEPDAARTADQLNSLQGPNSTTFKAEGVPVGALADTQVRFDVLLVADGLCENAAFAKMVADEIRRRRVVSISSDPACLQAKCCVLLVHSDRKVEIVLDTALANATGVHFSSVFTMLVKRQ